MGLDVGVVKIQYLDRPEGAAYRFAWHLAGNCDEADWTVSSDGNTIIEYEHGHMLSVADEYTTSQGLSSEDKVLLYNWIGGLPWENDVVMLHLSS